MSSQAQTQINAETYESVRQLAAHPAVTVVILSGADRNRLADTFGDMPNIWLVAENGVFMRPPRGFCNCDGQGWICNNPNLNDDWIDAVQLVFEYFCERTPRSYVEVPPPLPPPSAQTTLLCAYLPSSAHLLSKKADVSRVGGLGSSPLNSFVPRFSTENDIIICLIFVVLVSGVT
jgi:hypothetical protein